MSVNERIKKIKNKTKALTLSVITFFAVSNANSLTAQNTKKTDKKQNKIENIFNKIQTKYNKISDDIEDNFNNFEDKINAELSKFKQTNQEKQITKDKQAKINDQKVKEALANQDFLLLLERWTRGNPSLKKEIFASQESFINTYERYNREMKRLQLETRTTQQTQQKSAQPSKNSSKIIYKYPDSIKDKAILNKIMIEDAKSIAGAVPKYGRSTHELLKVKKLFETVADIEQIKEIREEQIRDFCDKHNVKLIQIDGYTFAKTDSETKVLGAKNAAEKYQFLDKYYFQVKEIYQNKNKSTTYTTKPQNTR